MVGAERLQSGLDCLQKRLWAEADQHLTEAQQSVELDASVLEQLAIARLLIGRQEASEECWISAHETYGREGDRRGASRCAFWLGLGLILRGETARGGGWLGQAHEALAGEEECAEHGLLMIPEGLHAMASGMPAEAEQAFVRARELGERLGAPEVVALGQLGLGQCLVRQGRAAEGLAVLDRVMVGVEAAAISPVLTGIAYCAVIEECQRVFDVARAREWTSALSRWLGSQPELVAYRGHCMVYRAEVVQRHGDWPAAVDEAEGARDRLAEPPGHPATGLALYRLGELHRLRGEFEEAEAAYTEANRWGRSPQPGLAELRFAQGDLDGSVATLHRLLDEAAESANRYELLGAAVKILIAAGDLDRARQAASELTALAAAFGAPFLQAHAEYCRGRIALAEDEPAAAVDALRACLGAWLEFQAPYEEALARIALATAYQSLGDDSSARLEMGTARALLEGLGAGPDLARLDGADPSPDSRADLSLRELQVLRLVATGATNRAIADALYISVRTVDRHVSNLYTKLGVSTRAAATAAAYELKLV